ncbi:hypothetical protein EI94DRAFT_1809856 [Lactarius quietus]|nr:hypothetical protein EI94DRAFT_1809856 [Lactarius quietus]
MSYLVTFVVSFLATLSVASPVARQTSVCPSGGSANASNFTMLAVSKTNTSDQRSVGLGSVGLSLLGSVGWLAATDTINNLLAENFILTDGQIAAYGSDGSPIGVSSPVPTANGKLGFNNAYDGVQIVPGEGYCELFNTTYGIGYSDILAVNGGDSENFSLCKGIGNEDLVIYNPVNEAEDETGFNFTTCNAVVIHILPIDQ